MGAISAVSAAAGRGGPAIAPLQSGGGGLSLFGVPDFEASSPVEVPLTLLAVPEWEAVRLSEPELSAFSLPDREGLLLPEPEVYLSGAPREVASAPVVTVSVRNENYIGAEVDVETVLREMEIRLAEAVASSMEGVYA